MQSSYIAPAFATTESNCRRNCRRNCPRPTLKPTPVSALAIARSSRVSSCTISQAPVSAGHEGREQPCPCASSHRSAKTASRDSARARACALLRARDGLPLVRDDHHVQVVAERADAVREHVGAAWARVVGHDHAAAVAVRDRLDQLRGL
eukprot:4650197-Pleurochrysis_carterae.AAC.3